MSSSGNGGGNGGLSSSSTSTPTSIITRLAGGVLGVAGEQVQVWLVKLPPSLRDTWQLGNYANNNSSGNGSTGGGLRAGFKTKQQQPPPQQTNGIQDLSDLGELNISPDGDVSISVNLPNSKEPVLYKLKRDVGDNIPKKVLSISADKLDIDVVGTVSMTGSFEKDDGRSTTSSFANKIKEKSEQARVKQSFVKAIDPYDELAIQRQKTLEIERIRSAEEEEKQSLKRDRAQALQNDGDEPTSSKQQRKNMSKEYVTEKILEAYSAEDEDGNKVTHLSTKDLIRMTGLTELSLKRGLQEICNYNNAGPFMGTWELKPNWND